jgi:hypothetical protein
MGICLKDKLALQEKQCFWWLTQISVFFLAGENYRSFSAARGKPPKVLLFFVAKEKNHQKFFNFRRHVWAHKN